MVCCPNDAAKTAGICQCQSPAIATAETAYHCTQLQQNIIQYKITYRRSSSSNTYTHRFNGHSPRQPLCADGPLIFPTGFAAKFSLAGCLSCDQPAETLGFTFSVTIVESLKGRGDTPFCIALLNQCPKVIQYVAINESSYHTWPFSR